MMLQQLQTYEDQIAIVDDDHLLTVKVHSQFGLSYCCLCLGLTDESTKIWKNKTLFGEKALI